MLVVAACFVDMAIGDELNAVEASLSFEPALDFDTVVECSLRLYAATGIPAVLVDNAAAAAAVVVVVDVDVLVCLAPVDDFDVE